MLVTFGVGVQSRKLSQESAVVIPLVSPQQNVPPMNVSTPRLQQSQRIQQSQWKPHLVRSGKGYMHDLKQR